MATLKTTEVLPVMSEAQTQKLGPAKLGITKEQLLDVQQLADELLDFRIGTDCKCGSMVAQMHIAVQVWNCESAAERDIMGMTNQGSSLCVRRTISGDNPEDAPGQMRLKLYVTKSRDPFAREDMDKVYHVYASSSSGLPSALRLT